MVLTYLLLIFIGMLIQWFFEHKVSPFIIILLGEHTQTTVEVEIEAIFDNGFTSRSNLERRHYPKEYSVKQIIDELMGEYSHINYTSIYEIRLNGECIYNIYDKTA